MSKTLRKKRHWLSKVQECVVSWGGPAGPDPDLLRGGAERGEFPYLAGRLPPGGEGAPGPALLSGKAPAPGDVLLEVNGTPVSGLTHRDTLAVVRHFREPVRLKTVRPGELGRRRPRRTRGPPRRPRLGPAAPAPCGAAGGPRRAAGGGCRARKVSSAAGGRRRRAGRGGWWRRAALSTPARRGPPASAARWPPRGPARSRHRCPGAPLSRRGAGPVPGRRRPLCLGLRLVAAPASG